MSHFGDLVRKFRNEKGSDARSGGEEDRIPQGLRLRDRSRRSGCCGASAPAGYILGALPRRMIRYALHVDLAPSPAAADKVSLDFI